MRTGRVLGPDTVRELHRFAARSHSSHADVELLGLLEQAIWQVGWWRRMWWLPEAIGDPFGRAGSFRPRTVGLRSLGAARLASREHASLLLVASCAGRPLRFVSLPWWCLWPGVRDGVGHG